MTLGRFIYDLQEGRIVHNSLSLDFSNRVQRKFVQGWSQDLWVFSRGLLQGHGQSYGTQQAPPSLIQQFDVNFPGDLATET